MLLSQRVDPSEPVYRILGTAILTLQKSDCTLDLPTFGVEPGSRRMVSRGYVVLWCKTIVSISNEKLRGRHTFVVFLILAQKTVLHGTPLNPSPHSPRLSQDMPTEQCLKLNRGLRWWADQRLNCWCRNPVLWWRRQGSRLPNELVHQHAGPMKMTLLGL